MSARHWVLAATLACAATAHAQPVELTTPVAGVVETVLVKSGQRVKRGIVLLKLESTRLTAELDIARAGRDRAELDHADAQRDLARAEDLYARTVSSTTELDAAKLRAGRTLAARKIAQAQLDIARRNLDDASLKAPFDGTVSSVAPRGTATFDCQPRTLLILEH